jgi:hypothetical protein
MKLDVSKLVAAGVFAAVVGAWVADGALADAGVDAGDPDAAVAFTDAGADGAIAEQGDASTAEELLGTEPPAPWELGDFLDEASHLPEAKPEPGLAPLIDGRNSVETEKVAIPVGERRSVVIKTIFGLLVLLGLAYVGGHRRVKSWERALGISQVITAGFPFVILGVIARLPSVDILSDAVLTELSPLLRIGLGWIGFVVGFRFDARLFGGLPEGTGRAVGLMTAIPFMVVAGGSGFLLLSLSQGMSGAALRDPVFLRDALILGTAGAMTATSTTRLLSAKRSESLLYRIIRLEELAGVLGLAIIAAYFRPQGIGVSWQLPGTAWLFVTIGLGVIIGALVYAILLRVHEGPEFVVVTLGSISFAAGAAGYLRMSPVVVAFVAALFLANFPGTYKERLGATLRRLERPIYLLSLVTIGALWQVGDWQGWLLMPVFMALRFIGKALATYLTDRQGVLALEPEEREALAIAPMGPLAIAIVVNAQMLYPGGSISRVLSGVIGGAILTEMAVQWKSRRVRAREAQP